MQSDNLNALQLQLSLTALQQRVKLQLSGCTGCCTGCNISINIRIDSDGLVGGWTWMDLDYTASLQWVVLREGHMGLGAQMQLGPGQGQPEHRHSTCTQTHALARSASGHKRTSCALAPPLQVTHWHSAKEGGVAKRANASE